MRFRRSSSTVARPAFRMQTTFPGRGLDRAARPRPSIFRGRPFEKFDDEARNTNIECFVMERTTFIIRRL